MEDDEFFTFDVSDAFLDKIDEDLDYAFALSLQAEIDVAAEPKQELKPSSLKPACDPLGIVDKQWELIDPNPDIHALFLQYNSRFFYGKLEGVEVKWSPRMTLCAGVCSYEGRGGLCSVRLSLPLLKLRPRRDLVETLLHEMIHAYLFVTANNKDHDAHGPEFLKHMNRINKETGTRISVYHSFHDEVDLYRKHWWKCNGPCQKRRPFFGLVKRASNRAPSSRDLWWLQHQSSCGGTFIKIKEPEDYKKKGEKRKPLKESSSGSPNIKKFMKTSNHEAPSNSKNPKKSSPFISSNVKSILATENNIVQISDHSSESLPTKEVPTIDPFSGQGFQLGSSSSSSNSLSFLAKIRQEMKSSNGKFPQKHLSSKSYLNDSSISTKEIKASNVNLSQRQLSSKSILSDSSIPTKEIKAPKGKLSQNNPSSRSFLNDFSRSTTTKHDNTKKKSVAEANSPLLTTSSSKLCKSPKLVQSSMKKFVWSSSSDSSTENSPKNEDSSANSSSKVNCPICFELIANSEINTHLDICLQK